VDLTAQWPYLEQVAFTRLANNKTERHVSKFGTEIELIGAAGELAARRFFHVSEELHTHFDYGADITYKGIRIDVKATAWTPRVLRRHMQWPVWKRIKADVILLTAVSIQEKSAILVGYALPHEIRRAPVNRERFIACYEIPVTRLRKPSQLLFAECRNDLYIRPQTHTNDRSQYYRPGAVA